MHTEKILNKICCIFYFRNYSACAEWKPISSPPSALLGTSGDHEAPSSRKAAPRRKQPPECFLAGGSLTSPTGFPNPTTPVTDSSDALPIKSRPVPPRGAENAS